MIIESTNVDLAQKPSFCQTPVTGSTGLNVLSLFDGMSCGRIALERAGIKVNNYYASEIDKYAIQVAKHNYPNMQHIGDVTQVKAIELPKIDILIGGSPCQGFSFAGKQLNFDDPRSKLFFEFVRLLKECTPKYFLLENVKMKKEYEDIITEYLGVKPIAINSELFSAQDRKRIYWTNINLNELPKENKLIVEDILEEEVDAKYFIDPKRSVIICENEVKKRKIAFIGSNSQGNRIYNAFPLKTFQARDDNFPFTGINHNRNFGYIRFRSNSIEEIDHFCLCIEKSVIHIDIYHQSTIINFFTSYRNSFIIFFFFNQS